MSTSQPIVRRFARRNKSKEHVMKNCRYLMLAVIIAVSCVFTVQPAGAVAIANAAADQRACTNIGPQPFRTSTLGLGVRAPHITQMNVQPCYEQDGTDTVPVTSDDELSCETIFPTAQQWLTVVGLGTSGNLLSMNTSACMVSANLLQQPDQPDGRVCKPGDANLKQCLTPE